MCVAHSATHTNIHTHTHTCTHTYTQNAYIWPHFPHNNEAESSCYVNIRTLTTSVHW